MHQASPRIFSRLLYRGDDALDLEAGIGADTDQLFSSLLDEHGSTASERAAKALAAAAAPAASSPVLLGHDDSLSTAGGLNIRQGAGDAGAHGAFDPAMATFGNPAMSTFGNPAATAAVGVEEAEGSANRYVIAFHHVGFSVAPAHPWLRYENAVTRSFGVGGGAKYGRLEESPQKSTTGGAAGAATSASAIGESTKVLLHGVSGGARRGEILAVMGPSGAGKTTLLEILAGRKLPASGRPTGSVVVDGRPNDAAEMWRWASGVPADQPTGPSSVHKIAYVAQVKGGMRGSVRGHRGNERQRARPKGR
jgi:ABC-type multidrug transport system fused ATPase/permease subunit